MKENLIRRLRWLGILSAALPLLVACQGVGFPVTVTEGDIEWQFPVLSGESCADFSGTYFNVGRPLEHTSREVGLTVLLTGGVALPIQGATFELHRQIPRNSDGSSVVITYGVLQHEARGMSITLVDARGTEYATGSLLFNGLRTGCHGNSLVIRDLRSHVNFEARMQLVTHSETAISKEPDGALVATRRSGSRERSLSIGHQFRLSDPRVDSWRFQRIEEMR